PGRFDRQITVDRPDVRGREAVLKVHARNKPLDNTVDLRIIAMRTPGFSGADLENLLNEAALVAARRDKTSIDMLDVDEAIDRVIAGPAKKSRVISEKERQIVAHHESGHTVIGMVLDDADTVHKVTIVPRGQAGGYAVMLPKEDRYIVTRPELFDCITGLLGGRVAEEIIFGRDQVSTGASNDFQRATTIATKMITEYGMSEKLGPTQFTGDGGEVFLGRDIGSDKNYSDAIAHEIDVESQTVINTRYEQAKKSVTDHREQLEVIDEKLLEVETLNAEQMTSLFAHRVMPDEPEDAEIVEDNTKNSTESYDEIKEKANKSHEEAKQKAEEEKDSDEEQPTDANNNDEDESENEEK